MKARCISRGYGVQKIKDVAVGDVYAMFKIRGNNFGQELLIMNNNGEEVWVDAENFALLDTPRQKKTYRTGWYRFHDYDTTGVKCNHKYLFGEEGKFKGEDCVVVFNEDGFKDIFLLSDFSRVQDEFIKGKIRTEREVDDNELEENKFE